MNFWSSAFSISVCIPDCHLDYDTLLTVMIPHPAFPEKGMHRRHGSTRHRAWLFWMSHIGKSLLIASYSGEWSALWDKKEDKWCKPSLLRAMQSHSVDGTVLITTGCKECIALAAKFLSDYPALTIHRGNLRYFPPPPYSHPIKTKNNVDLRALFYSQWLGKLIRSGLELHCVLSFARRLRVNFGKVAKETYFLPADVDHFEANGKTACLIRSDGSAERLRKKQEVLTDVDQDILI